MKKAVLYLHGKGGSSAEADFYRRFFDGDVLGLDYNTQVPWEAVSAIRQKYRELDENYDKIALIANSIGAWFSLLALSDCPLERAYFISPVVDMEGLICNMMRWAGVTEQMLRERGEIAVPFGEPLSWKYLCFVREHPIHWEHKTDILYGETDSLVSLAVIRAFAQSHQASLTVMPGGEHWFHTPEQMDFLSEWLIQRKGEE